MRIFDTVIEILAELSGSEAVAPKSRLQEDLVLDSLHMVMLLTELENRLGIMLDESDMNPFDLELAADVVELAEKYCGDENEEKN